MPPNYQAEKSSFSQDFIRYSGPNGRLLPIEEDKPFARESLEFEVIGLRLIVRSQATKIAHLQKMLSDSAEQPT